jgi:hypothetical protein
MLIAMLLLSGCTGRTLEAGTETVSTFAAVDATVRSTCMLCHSVPNNSPGNLFTFPGNEAGDYQALQPFVTDGGAELLARVEHHGGLRPAQIEAWSAWIATGMEP